TFALDKGAEGAWSKFVELIFGNQPALPGADPTRKPFSSILIVRPARLDKQLRDKINSFAQTDGTDEEKRPGKIQKQKYLAALTFIKPGVAIDGVTGTAWPAYLRFEEMGRSSTVLEA